MTSLPLVSFIVPTFNRADWLPETLRSLHAQTYPNLEIVVVDDGSTDQTPAVLAALGAECGERMRWVRHDNAGQSAAVNRGLELAGGELLMMVSSDDPQPPHLLPPLVEAMCADPGLAGVYPDWEMIDDEGLYMRTVRSHDYAMVDMVRWFACLPGPGTLVRRTVADQIGGWDPSFRYCPDYEWYLRMGLVGLFKRVPQTLACWRHHPGSITAGPPSEARARELVRLMEVFFGRDDLPDAVRAVRPEAFRNAYITAALSVDDDAGSTSTRFTLSDRLDRPVQEDDERPPVSRNPAVVIPMLHREVARRDITIRWLHDEVSVRDRTIDDLARRLAALGQSAEDTAVWLHGEVASRDAVVATLHAEVAARDAAIERLTSPPTA